MGGTNPNIEEADHPLPTRKFKITYRVEGEEQRVEVDPDKIPYDRDGLPGSILEIGLGNGLDIDHACGGVCACSTCHIIVREGGESCNASTDDEEDQLDNAPGLTPQSRLACQCVPNGTCDVVVEVPNWNRNAAKEEEH